MEIAIINQQKEKIGNLNLKEDFWQEPYSPHSVSLYIKAYLANQRPKRAGPKVKNRGEVKRSTRKLHAQKGTGLARVGDAGAPHRRGGGVAHGPTGRKNYSLSVNEKTKKKALQSIINRKIKDKKLLVIDKIEIPDYKTKQANIFLNQIGLREEKILIVFSSLEMKNNEIKRPFSNLAKTQTTNSQLVNVYQLLTNPWLVFTQRAFEELKSRLIKYERNN